MKQGPGPVGAAYLSPALQRWVSERRKACGNCETHKVKDQNQNQNKNLKNPNYKTTNQKLNRQPSTFNFQQ
jgi:formate dehydrogenase assembly factor FdhD